MYVNNKMNLIWVIDGGKLYNMSTVQELPTAFIVYKLYIPEYQNKTRQIYTCLYFGEKFVPNSFPYKTSKQVSVTQSGA